MIELRVDDAEAAGAGLEPRGVAFRAIRHRYAAS